MTSPLPPPPDGLDPELFAVLGANFMSAKLLAASVNLGIFEALGDGARTLDELAAATKLPHRSLRTVANGLAAIGVLELEGDRYKNAPPAQAFLAGKTSVDVRAGLKLYGQLIYPMWLQLEDVVRSGSPAKHAERSEAFAKLFSEGVEAWTAVGARALVREYDFSNHRRVLDVAGGTGSYLVPILTQHPHLRATLFDLPPTIAVARQRLASEPCRDRVELAEGDAFFDAIPSGHDVALVAGFIHLFDGAKAKLLFRRIREHVEPGAKLLVVEQWMDATHTRPVFGAMLAVTYLMLSGEGGTYSVDEAEPWLRESGWRFLEHKQLEGVTSVVVAEAV
jgi:ubiquinone/menaquinone biosynthesis C-methylase UbiE